MTKWIRKIKEYIKNRLCPHNWIYNQLDDTYLCTKCGKEFKLDDKYLPKY